MRDARLTRGFFKIVTAEDQEAGNGSLFDSTDNSQSNIEWIYGSPELDLLTDMEIEAAHCALRDQTGGLDLFELVHAGETPIGPHVNLLCFRSNAWKLIADLMVNAAVNHERCNSDDMGDRGNFGLVSYGQRITQSHFGAEQVFENQRQIFRHISLLRLCRNLERSSRFCRYTAFFHSDEYSLVQAVNGIHETLGTRVVGDHHNSLVKLCLELRQQD